MTNFELVVIFPFPNLQEATELYLEEFPHQETQHPLLTTFEVTVNA